MAENKKVVWHKLLDLVHSNKENASYKSLQILKTDKNIVLQLTEGVAQQSKNKILFQLNEQELSLLVLRLQKILFDLWNYEKNK